MSFSVASQKREGEGGTVEGKEEESKGRDSYVYGFHSEEN